MHAMHVVLVALLASCTCVKAFTWTPCDADVVPFTPDHVDLVPDPPAAGGQVTFKIEGNAGGDLICCFLVTDVAHDKAAAMWAAVCPVFC
jgi:hypothetical protein